MSTHAALLALAPVLLAQGLYVRFRTPRIDEPIGPRQGKCGAGPPLRLLIAGDSAAAGVGVEQQASALAGQLVSQLSSCRSVEWTLLAQTGWTASDLAQRLRAAPRQHFDVAVLSIGVNDVTGGTRAPRFATDIAAINRVLEQRFAVRTLIYNRIPPMERFPALPGLLARHLGNRAQRLNTIIGEMCAQHVSRQFLNWELEIEAQHMAADGFHPGAPAYALWAQLIATRILEPDTVPPDSRDVAEWMARNDRVVAILLMAVSE